MRREAADTRLTPPNDAYVSVECPLLWELLTQDRYRNGEVRVLPTIRIERISGGYEVVLQEHSVRKQVRTIVLRLGEVAEALERCLTADLDAWRPYDSPKVRERDLMPKEKKG